MNNLIDSFTNVKLVACMTLESCLSQDFDSVIRTYKNMLHFKHFDLTLEPILGLDAFSDTEIKTYLESQGLNVILKRLVFVEDRPLLETVFEYYLEMYDCNLCK
jgi:hypothetical protein